MNVSYRLPGCANERRQGRKTELPAPTNRDSDYPTLGHCNRGNSRRTLLLATGCSGYRVHDVPDRTCCPFSPDRTAVFLLRPLISPAVSSTTTIVASREMIVKV